MSDATPTKARFQFSLLTLLLGIVFAGACVGLCVRWEQNSWVLQYPEFWVALFVAVPLLCSAFSECREWLEAWWRELQTARSVQLLTSILVSWVVAYVWTALVVAIRAQNVRTLGPFFIPFVLPVWLTCLVRIAGAVYVLTREWPVVQVPLTALVVLVLCWLFAMALFLLIYVHFMAGGHL